jgi:hypothetical protein
MNAAVSPGNILSSLLLLSAWRSVAAGREQRCWSMHCAYLVAKDMASTLAAIVVLGWGKVGAVVGLAVRSLWR